MRTEIALLRLLKKIQSLEASRDRLSIAESVVVATLEILDARFALLHGFRATPHGYVTAPLSWAVSEGESATTNLDHLDVEETHLAAEPLLEECALASNGYALIEEDGRCTLAFAIGPVGAPVAVVEVHCDSAPTDALRDCIHELLGIYAEHLGLLDYAELDTLTRLHNRKTFDENFDRFIGMVEQAVQRREGGVSADVIQDRHCWLAVADIDKFKRINDNFGHLFGDEVLIRVADLMKKSFRGSDKLFRFGGEEFVVLLRFISAENAEHVLERFRLAVEEHEFPQVGQVTCSLGYVQIDPLLTPAEILGRADEALYFCKENGRNQVQRYEDLVAQGLIAAPVEAQITNADLQADIDSLFD
ncbi:GGDEF domain-containing protein [Uliginosibacterium sp. 31-16]|uniref:GGDEF domain-containing protein n=1 Tax=Uliginosibacterium sp. 31-16 TaxID=3068315 RepID=UPI00273DA9AE|nr:GGDEF domain-containing protein [Uliginosibacterium sp. 31-16]MDP5240632.1 GGDEF domain-containing protein [Uliginosibacterium sp. 31-16]